MIMRYLLIIPPANFVCGGYTVFKLSVHPSVNVYFVDTVNVLKFRTQKIFIFATVCYFRNYFSEKMLVFEILECGLYQEKKNNIYACQKVVETC